MMQHKKIVTLALAGALTATMFTPALAVNNTETISSTPLIAQQEEVAVEYTRTIGVVQEVDVQAQNILVKNEQTEIQFNLDAKTWLVDGEKGTTIDLADLKGKEVVVAHSMATTRSLPPQSYAYAVVTKGEVTPNYAIVEAVEAGKDGAVRLTTNNGGMWVTVTEKADIKPLATKDIVTLEDLQPGAQVILYYDIVALSYPGQAYTDRVVLLKPAEEPIAEENVEMVGIRQAASELGLDVAWDHEGQTVTLSKEGYKATISVGSAKYGYTKLVEKDGKQTKMIADALAEQAPELRDGRTYVPKSMLEALKQQMQ